MKLLKDKIMSEGIVLNDAILKVDSFLNHQIDPELMVAIGKEFAERFKECKIDKVFTIESSGIACALTTALCLHVPVVFARKQKSELMSSPAYTTKVYSFTKKVTSDVSVLKKFLHEGETVLIVDDFLANGEAAQVTLSCSSCFICLLKVDCVICSTSEALVIFSSRATVKKYCSVRSSIFITSAVQFIL